MGDNGGGAVHVKRLSIFDVSFEDDRLIDASPTSSSLGPQFSDDRSLGLLRGPDLEKADEEEGAVASKPPQLTEEKTSKTPENYHLRKSLAWDTAFFTSDGVLEPDELTSMIEDAGKKEKPALPMILEEIQRSTESISSLASDTLTLASLEADLFEDIRASIQKSSKISKTQTFGSEVGKASLEALAHPSLMNTDETSHGKLRSKPAPKKSSLGMIRPAKTTNQALVHRRVSQVQSVALGHDSNSLPSKPPKPGMLCAIPSSTKRESLGANRVKLERNNIEGRGASAPKVPVSSGTRNIVPRPSSSRSSLARLTAVKNALMTPPSDSSASSSSGKSGKSPVDLRSKGAELRSRKLSSAGSSSLKTPPRSTSSRLSAHFVPATKLSSSVSPSSSISEWSPDSSSSASTVKQRSNGSRSSLEPSSSEKTCDDGDYGHQVVGPKTRGSASSALHVKNASTGGTLLLPSSMRPSGLRMPSPKIGFFDGTKSGRTPNMNQKSPRVVSSGPPKIGAGISTLNGSTNKVNVVKFQSARPAGAMSSMTGASRKSSSDGSRESPPLSSPNSVKKFSGASDTVKRPPGISPRVQSRVSPKFGIWNQSKAEEVIKAKESYVETRDKESPEVKPTSDAIKTNAVVGLDTSNVVVHLVDDAQSPAKSDDCVENGPVFVQSLTSDSPKLAAPEHLSCFSKISPPPSTVKADIAASARQPFTAIDSFCNMADSCDVSACPDTAEVGKRTALPSQSPSEETS